MAEPGLTITTTDGGLGQTGPNNDNLACFVYYAPEGSSWSPSGLFRSLKEVQDAADDDSYTIPGDLGYWLSEMFRIVNKNSGDARCYVRVITTVIKGNEGNILAPIQAEFDGEIRLFFLGGGDYDSASTETLADWITVLSAELETMWTTDHTPAFCLVAPSYADDATTIVPSASSVSGPTLADTARTLSLVVADTSSGEYDGNNIATYELGEFAGTLKSNPVQANIGRAIPRNRVDLSDGTNQLPLIDGTDYADFTKAQRGSVFDAHLLYLNKRPNLDGVYPAGDPTLATATSDYNRINRVRVAQKLTRLLSATYAPFVNAGVNVDTGTGYLTDPARESLADVGQEIIDSTARQPDAAIAGGSVTIDEEQNILSTNKLNIKLRFVPLGMLEEIELDLGFDNPAIA